MPPTQPTVDGSFILLVRCAPDQTERTCLLLLGTFLSLFPCRGHYGQAWDRPPEGGGRVRHVNREIVRS